MIKGKILKLSPFLIGNWLKIGLYQESYIWLSKVVGLNAFVFADHNVLKGLSNPHKTLFTWFKVLDFWSKENCENQTLTTFHIARFCPNMILSHSHFLGLAWWPEQCESQDLEECQPFCVQMVPTANRRLGAYALLPPGILQFVHSWVKLTVPFPAPGSIMLQSSDFQ